ncbi:hypothetical protein M409DRAFT_69607 [Zasmidium cellare ATCC 36951]|uniref:Major facilitator superfamily (MFS) profile domain-containing protein n=1 Tax=Zasmidium cellare ATCC 36951 TaxID=1080233 RepID=A0A6A6C463_ZASCE|nr:uncharacterized protein M409DRAFT_69607 [Zasmidium cellare ATCC 36951]KAF2161811.1 hypothetical protein M409DRAFT_69607 [Zasmidium cellare ATCC 36951]
MPGEKNVGLEGQATASGSITERTPLIPPTPTIVGHPNDDGPQALADVEGATNARPPSRPSTAKSLVDDAGHVEANQKISLLRGVLCTFALGCLIFLQATNISMLTTIGSYIADDLEVYEQTSWFTSTYLISMSALGPLNGKLSSVFSPRVCIFVAAVLMAIGAILCSLANSFASFLVGRAIAGVGASGVFTISIIIVLELTGSKRKGIAIGTLNSGYTVGVAIGATATGALVDLVGWRALFWAQAPILLFGGLILFLAIPRDFTSGKQDESGSSMWKRASQLDFLGAVTLTTSLILLLYGLSSSKEIPILPIVLSIIVGTIFVLIELYVAADPVIPVELLKSRGLLLTCLGTVSYMMARWSVLFFTPTYAIAVRQWSSSIGGAMLIPTNGGFAAGGLLVGWLHIKRQGSFYAATMVSYAIFPFTLVLLAILAHREGSAAGFVTTLFICGFATGAALNYNLAHLLHLTPKDTHYVASALIATFRGFAGSFGSAIGGGLFTRTLSTSLKAHFAERGLHRDTLIRQLLGSPKLVQKLEGVDKDVAVQSYEEGLRMLWLCAAALAFATVFVQAGVGWKGHKEKVAEQEERQALLHDGEARDREEAR